MDEQVEIARVRAIEHGELDDCAPSRRRRRAVLAVDRDGDVAAVLEATRGKRRGSSLAVHAYRRDGSLWRSMGSAAVVSDDPRLEDRSGFPPRSIELEMSGSAGGRRRGAIHDALLRVGPDISTLRWRGADRPVSVTGYAVVVWQGRRGPLVAAFDTDGTRVSERAMHRPDDLWTMPWRARVRLAAALRRRGDDWFNYAPRR